MKCTVSLFTILTIIISTFILPTEIECCSNNLNDIISIMSQPDFQRNPCYIQWKAEQDKKYDEIWRARDELEKSIARNNEIRERNRQIEQQNWQNSFRRTTVEKKKEMSAGMIFAIIVGIICAICCCTVCYSLIQSDDDSTAITTTNNLPYRNPEGFTVVATSPGLATSSFGNQRATDLSSPTSANANLTTFNVDVRSSPSPIQPTPRQQQETNVPLLPRGVINRQNSLPSYDDAVKMPSAPPR